MDIRLTLDRTEGMYGICIDENEKVISFDLNLLEGIREGDSFIADISEVDGKYILVIKDLLVEENKKRHFENSSRLHRLFKNK